MKKLALITGATSGIGKATAHLLASNGFDLIITGRREELLNDLTTSLRKDTAADVLSLCFDIKDSDQVKAAVVSLSGKW